MVIASESRSELQVIIDQKAGDQKYRWTWALKPMKTHEDELESTRINWNPRLSLTPLISIFTELSTHGPGREEVEAEDLARV